MQTGEGEKKVRAGEDRRVQDTKEHLMNLLLIIELPSVAACCNSPFQTSHEFYVFLIL